MTKEQFICDLCSVEFRSKSKTKELVDKFIGEVFYTEMFLPMGVSKWKEHGIKYGYWDYFKDEVNNN